MFAQVGTAEEMGLCSEGGKWVAICNTHATVLNASRKKDLQKIDTEEFCDCCRGTCIDWCTDCKVN